jgi:hypothetical protein
VNAPRFLKMLLLKTVPIARMAPLAAVLVDMQVISYKLMSRIASIC